MSEGGCWFHSPHNTRPVAVSCEHGNEPFRFPWKTRNFERNWETIYSTLLHIGQNPVSAWFQHPILSSVRVVTTTISTLDTGAWQLSHPPLRSRDYVSIFLPSRAGGYLPRDLRKSIRLPTARMAHRSIPPASVHFGLVPSTSSLVRMINHSPPPSPL
jgi:hypothetical protein